MVNLFSNFSCLETLNTIFLSIYTPNHRVGVGDGWQLPCIEHSNI